MLENQKERIDYLMRSIERKEQSLIEEHEENIECYTMIEKKDKQINLMAEFFNKRSWREHQLKDDDCYCCKKEYGAEDCEECIIAYFENKAST